MTHTHSNLLSHIMWSTKHRQPLITKEIKPRFHSYIRKIIDDFQAKLLFINGVEDHVHILVATPLKLLIPDLMEKIKPTSTKWFNKTFHEISNTFSWQEGYGAFSVGKSNLQEVINYIKKQEEDHKTVSYQDEYIGFLKAQGIPYNEKFIFD